MPPTIRILFATLLGVSVATTAEADRPEPTAALIAASEADAALADALAIRLVQDDVALVDRQHVRAVLAEQELNAALTGDDRGPRLRLGRLLGADVLIVIPDGGGPSPGGLLFLSTATGLRFNAIQPPVEDDEAWLDWAATAAVDAVARYATPPRRVVGVGAFLDLNFDRGIAAERRGFSAAVSGLIESHLLHQPDTWLVELDEAQALVREQALTGGNGGAGGEGVDRLAAYYIQGEFRLEDRQTRIDLRFVRPGAPTRTVTLRGPQKELGPRILRSIQDYFAEQQGPSRVSLPIADEYALLLERADRFAELDHGEAAVGLLEAAVLLRPGDGQARARLIRELIRLAVFYVNQETGASRWRPTDRPLEAAAAAYERMLEHLEFSLGDQLLDADTEADLLAMLSIPGQWVRYRANQAPAYRRSTWPEGRVLLDRQWQVRRSIIRQRIAAGDRAGVERLIPGDLAFIFVWHEPATKWAELWALAEEVRALPDPEPLMRKVLRPGVGIDDKGRTRVGVDDTYKKRVEQWSRSGDPIRRNLAAELQATIDRDGTPSQHRQPPQGDVPEPGFVATTEALDYRFLDENGRPLAKLPWIRQWVSADEYAEIAAGHRDVFVSREPGEMSVALRWTPADRRLAAPDWQLAYDGRWAWAVTPGRYDTPCVVAAIDPRTGRVVRVAPEHGLYPADGDLIVKPIAPGRAALVGSTQRTHTGTIDRTWIAVADVTDPERPRLTNVHEAKDRRIDFEENGLDVAFRPTTAVLVRDTPGSGHGPRELLIPRGTRTSPLAVDLQTLAVSVRDVGRRSHFQHLVDDAEGAYVIEWRGGTDRNRLWRLNPDEPYRTGPVADPLPEGWLYTIGQHYHLIRRGTRATPMIWRVADRLGGPWRVVKPPVGMAVNAETPPMFSRRHGLIVTPTPRGGSPVHRLILTPVDRGDESEPRG
ncbi:MAG: hypothetical protein AAFX76_05185 [Planctomycetota bacterium]